MAKKIPSEVAVQFGKANKTFEVIPEPLPHILVEGSQKELHGWYVPKKVRGPSPSTSLKVIRTNKRECTAERMLINPYNGCSHACPFCYALNFRGYFELFLNRRVITVFKNFDQAISRQLDTLDISSCGYLSPVTDPFQPINSKYRLSEKILKEFIKRNIPIEFITKGKVSSEAIDLIRKQKHSFGQISILTLDEELRQKLVPGGISAKTLLRNFRRLRECGIYTVARIDPIIPLITDDIKELKKLISQVAFFGANHIIVSCLDVPWRIKNKIIEALVKIKPDIRESYSKLYTEEIDGYFQADINYRKKLFSEIRKACEKEGLTFALCMEYELVGGKPRGLNREFASSTNCEGMDIPIYLRKGKRFEPAVDCSGACLTCKHPHCGLEDLAMGRRKDAKKDWKLADYQRWSQQLSQGKNRSFFKSRF